MRAMVVWPGADWSVGDIASGWAWGLDRIGVDVVPFRLDHRLNVHRRTLLHRDGVTVPAWTPQQAADVAADSLLAAVYASAPDVIVIVSGWEIPPRVYRLLEHHGETVVLHHTESPYEDDRHAEMAWCARLHLVNDPVGVDRMRAAGARAFYARQCYRPDVHHPGTGRRDPPFVFFGSVYGGRRAFFEQMARPDGVEPVLAGQWLWSGDGADPLGRYMPDWLPPPYEPLSNDRTADLYRRACMSMNIYRTDFADRGTVDGWAMGPREVELAACGTWFARQPRPEGDEVLPMLPRFDTPDEASDLLAWWWAHPDARDQAAAEARAAVADRSFDQLAAGLVGLLDREGALRA